MKRELGGARKLLTISVLLEEEELNQSVSSPELAVFTRSIIALKI